jgi:23S rRNA pseudouridine2457 synthase
LKSYILFYKPYGVLSQFTPEAGHPSLSDFGLSPKDVYPVGRLDKDSEGLLLLTNDSVVKHRLTDPSYKHPRTYLVQIENIPTEETLKRLCEGVYIKNKKTRQSEVRLLARQPDLPPRLVPIRTRKTIPTAWLEITLREGRNRQIRHMTAAVGHPTLRLIRVAITFLTLTGLTPGQSRNLTKAELQKLYDLLSLS